MNAVEFIVANSASQALGWAVVHSLWQGALIAAGFGAVLFCSRSPRVRCAAGCFALLAMAASFAFTIFGCCQAALIALAHYFLHLFPLGRARLG